MNACPVRSKNASLLSTCQSMLTENSLAYPNPSPNNANPTRTPTTKSPRPLHESACSPRDPGASKNTGTLAQPRTVSAQVSRSCGPSCTVRPEQKHRAVVSSRTSFWELQRPSGSLFHRASTSRGVRMVVTTARLFARLSQPPRPPCTKWYARRISTARGGAGNSVEARLR